MNEMRQLLDSVKPLFESYNDYQGASAQDVYDAIDWRINQQHKKLLNKHGATQVKRAMRSVAEFHAGAEELGSSDISHMVSQVYQELGEDPNAAFRGGPEISMEDTDLSESREIDTLLSTVQEVLANIVEYANMAESGEMPADQVLNMIKLEAARSRKNLEKLTLQLKYPGRTGDD